MFTFVSVINLKDTLMKTLSQSLEMALFSLTPAVIIGIVLFSLL